MEDQLAIVFVKTIKQLLSEFPGIKLNEEKQNICLDNARVLFKLMKPECYNDQPCNEVLTSLIEILSAVCLGGIKLSLALKWLAGALTTDWVRKELTHLPIVLMKLGVDPDNANIRRTELDSPYDFVVRYNNTIYIIEITKQGKTVNDIVKKMSDHELEMYCSEDNVKIVVYTYKDNTLMIEDLKGYCNSILKLT